MVDLPGATLWIPHLVDTFLGGLQSEPFGGPLYPFPSPRGLWELGAESVA
jgi:hypothetical protein